MNRLTISIICDFTATKNLYGSGEGLKAMKLCITIGFFLSWPQIRSSQTNRKKPTTLIKLENIIHLHSIIGSEPEKRFDPGNRDHNLNED